MQQGRPAEAEAAFRRAIKLEPDDANAHCNLGRMLLLQERFSEAVEERRRGHELGSKQKNWSYPSAEWVREAERLAALGARLPALLSGAAQPGDAGEWLTLTHFCQDYKERYAAAARFYAGAFAAVPKPAEEPNGNRYDAACMAALAGCGQGDDAATLDDAGRARLRRQALDWLRGELAVWTKRAETPTDRPKVRQSMQHCQKDPDFAGVRDAAALANLPEPERAAWQKLWADVAELLKRTDEPKAAEKPGQKP
jgi:hypothetical protein